MSLDPVTLLAFVPAALALNLTPGADMMFCLGQGLRSGARPAIAASAGISLGAFVHCALAGLGLSTLIAAVPAALDVIRWIGVSYLLWLAVQALRSGPVSATGRVLRPARAFREGLIVNLTNPKVILFVLAFIPQFIRIDAGPVLLQFLIFGAIIATGGFVVNGLVGYFAGGIGRKLATNATFHKWLGGVTAGIFSALALRLAMVRT